MVPEYFFTAFFSDRKKQKKSKMEFSNRKEAKNTDKKRKHLLVKNTPINVTITPLKTHF